MYNIIISYMILYELWIAWSSKLACHNFNISTSELTFIRTWQVHASKNFTKVIQNKIIYYHYENMF